MKPLPVVITLMVHAELEPDDEGAVGVHVNGMNYTTMGHFGKDSDLTEAQKAKIVTIIQKVVAKALLSHLEGQQSEQETIPVAPLPKGGATA
ncbi:hypothetical protein [Caudoviricetes sp.]|nr:hypothetical protein [Caudoviricetes sp.]UOF81868.1 hypothetical protein [Caudoviricetes sp.]